MFARTTYVVCGDGARRVFGECGNTPLLNAVRHQHLEAARLLIEREPSGEFRNQVLERVVAARSMARDGLVETRQALSALRGEVSPVEDYLRQLVAAVEPEPGSRARRFGCASRRRDGRAVDCAGLENRLPAMVRGFESHSLSFRTDHFRKCSKNRHLQRSLDF